jgi:hypothetical protein
MAKNIIVLQQDQVFIDYINKELDVKFNPNDCRTVSHVRENDDGTFTILAVVAYNRWDVNHCEGSIAATDPRWASWGFVHAAYEYGFNAGHPRSRLHFVVSLDNEKALNMHTKLGHVREALMVDIFGENKDGYLYRFTRREYENSKWFDKKNRN